jgi:lipid-A-disaccharide synthase
MTGPPLCVMIVTGEASGDDRGAGLARALKARLGEGVRFVGVGGARMAEAGIKSPFDIAEISILGLLEGLFAYRRIMRRVADTVALAVREKPDVAVLIDSWGFTLRVAHQLRDHDPRLPLVKYVGPQVWATRPGRAKTLAHAVDHLLTIHSFDAPLFEAEGLPTTFVGNAALNVDFSRADPQRLRRQLGLGAEDPILLVLPGSRPSEVRRMLPVFEDAVGRLKVERPNLAVVIPAAPTVAEAVKALVAGWPHRVHVVEGDEAKLDAMKAGTFALACSGTVTVELALAGCPMVIGYRLDPITAFVAMRLLLRTPYITLFNIAAQAFVAPELLQGACNGETLAREAALRLDDPALRARQVEAQYAALDRMGRGGPDPAEAAAEALLKILAARRA